MSQRTGERTTTLVPSGPPQITRLTLPTCRAHYPDGPGRVRASVASPSARPSPKLRRVGVRDFTCEACSSFTHVTACRIAQSPEATFVTRLRPGGLPLQTGSPALLVELKAAGMKHNVLGVPRLCQLFAPPRSRSGSKRQACPKMRSLPTGSQLSDYFLSTKSAGEPSE